MERTFNLSLTDAEFVACELPPSDGFTKALWRWCIEERARQEEEERLAEERWARIEPMWNAMLLRVVGR